MKIFFRTTRPISTKLGTKDTKHPWLKGTQGFKNKDHSFFKKMENGFSSPIQRYELEVALRKCVYWFELLFQVSDVEHGLLD